MTAKAADTVGIVAYRTFVLVHRYDLGRTNLGTLCAADTAGMDKVGLRANQARQASVDAFGYPKR